jgi:hypothetical protein
MKKWMYIVIGMMLSCSQAELSSMDFIKYVDNPANGLIQQTQSGSLVFKLQYRPPEYEWLKAAGHNINLADLEEQRKLQFFVLKIEHESANVDVLAYGTRSSVEYQQRIIYLTSAVQNDFVLIDGTDTLPCVMHHWERTYKLTNYTTLLLAFPASKEGVSDKTVVFYDEIFGVGKTFIQIPKAKIQAIPKLKV